jgi:hypothetical protein
MKRTQKLIQEAKDPIGLAYYEWMNEWMKKMWTSVVQPSIVRENDFDWLMFIGAQS